MRANSVFTKEHEKIAQYAKALGHPIRVYILQELLSRQECCKAGEISDRLPIAKSTFSQHLKELKQVGLIQGEINLPNIKYCINKKNWKEVQLLLGKVFDLHK